MLSLSIKAIVCSTLLFPGTLTNLFGLHGDSADAVGGPHSLSHHLPHQDVHLEDNLGSQMDSKVHTGGHML